MSRPGPSSRSLSATEELEKLEQSVTLTLQEIDQNFSKAHRIVTSSILPLVEQYGEQSRAVWEASKFWKQFFEASANVSLSGYEELANDDTTVNESTARDETMTTEVTDSTSQMDLTTASDAQDNKTTYRGEESLLDDGDLTGSTPRLPATKTIRPQFSDHQSPYEMMRREMEAEEYADDSGAPEDADADVDADDRTQEGVDEEDDSTVLFRQRTARLPDIGATPRIHNSELRKKDYPFSRVLDRYKTNAQNDSPNKFAPPLSVRKHHPAAPVAQKKAETVPSWRDSPMSSPEMAVPTLRSAAFMSPARGAAKLRAGGALGLTAPRTPGVSVQTPAAVSGKTRDVFGTADSGRREKGKYEIDWESDSEGGGFGMSPPKTIQFALPQSKLLQTPAREASRRIVEDILMTAGAGPEESTEYSPTMVKMNEDVLDDTF